MRFFTALVVALLLAPAAPAYSVLTHEAIVDAAWKDSIKPLLLKRFPAATADDLRKAHAYAYGGAIVQDMGYYPFGSTFFSELAHYVRSGDLVQGLLAESADLNEYAFALGALAHYAADNNGHRAVNQSVPLLYPKLQNKFGDIVTYADDKVSHIKVEFAFDVAQVAQGFYAPDAYRDFIGFEVSRPVLERAFARTYSLELSTVLDEDLAIGIFRFTVAAILPTATRAAWQIKKDEIKKAQPSMTKRRFVYNLSRSSYRRKWGRSHREPGAGTRFVAFLFRIVPKVGPLRAFGFLPPTPATETMFMKSFNLTLDEYRDLLAAHAAGSLNLPNRNIDTGDPVQPGKYRLTDFAYAKLVESVNSQAVPAELRAAILAFYSDLNAPPDTKTGEAVRQRLRGKLEALKAQESPGSQPAR